MTKGIQMRYRLLAGTAAMILPALMRSPSATAMTLGDVSAMRSAIEATTPVEKACWGFGWRGWGWYPGWFRPACGGAYVAPVAPAYVAPAYVAPAYVAPDAAYAAPAPVPPPAGPRKCWVQSDPDRNSGYWAAC
jgi:hypothetical protein